MITSINCGSLVGTQNSSRPLPGNPIEITQMTTIIAPSILSADFTKLGDEIRAVENGGAGWIHVDVMDGHFVPNITIGVPVVASIRKATKLPLDVHLMIENPDSYIDEFAKAGADYITVHAELYSLATDTFSDSKVRQKAGVALNPATPPEVLSYCLADIDLVLVMSVNPGFGGQKFIDAVVPKIKSIRKMFDENGYPDVKISVDGGINTITAKKVVAAGVDVLVAGSSIYGSNSVDKAIEELKSASAASGDSKVNNLAHKSIAKDKEGHKKKVG